MSQPQWELAEATAYLQAKMLESVERAAFEAMGIPSAFFDPAAAAVAEDERLMREVQRPVAEQKRNWDFLQGQPWREDWREGTHVASRPHIEIQWFAPPWPKIGWAIYDF